MSTVVGEQVSAVADAGIPAITPTGHADVDGRPPAPVAAVVDGVLGAAGGEPHTLGAAVASDMAHPAFGCLDLGGPLGGGVGSGDRKNSRAHKTQHRSTLLVAAPATPAGDSL